MVAQHNMIDIILPRKKIPINIFANFAKKKNTHTHVLANNFGFFCKLFFFFISCRHTLESYYLELKHLAMELLALLGKAVKIDMKKIEELFEDGMQSVRITYYPPCPQPELVIGLTPHSDASGITILHQLNGVDGLQIKKDGNWAPVNVLEDAFVVNVGDIVEVCRIDPSFSLTYQHKVSVKKENQHNNIYKVLYHCID